MGEPASACLCRHPYFTEVTEEKLRIVEQAENVLRDLGFRICRVRHHETVARIEFGRDGWPAAGPAVADVIDVSCARGISARHDDLRGYRLGSLNDALRLRPV